MDYAQLKQFITLAEVGNMRAAAQMLYLTQPALSHTLKSLEKELDCRLFDRARNKLALNDYGRAFYRYAISAIDRVGVLRAELSEIHLREKMCYKISSSSLTYLSFLMPMMAAGLPNYSFRCCTAPPQTLSDRLLDGRADFAIRGRRRLANNRTTGYDETDPALAATLLCREQLMVSLPGDSPLKGRPVLYLSDLEGQKTFLSMGNTGYVNWFQEVADASRMVYEYIDGVSVPSTKQVSLGEDCCYLTTSFFLSFMPTPEGRIVLPLADLGATRDILLVYKADNAAKAKIVVDFVEQSRDKILGNSAYVSYFIYHDKLDNLSFVDGQAGS